jgi:hypothetical protein
MEDVRDLDDENMLHELMNTIPPIARAQTVSLDSLLMDMGLFMLGCLPS